MPKFKPKENDNTNYNELIVLCELDTNNMCKLRYYTTLPITDECHIEKIKTPRGYAVKKADVEKAFSVERRGRPSQKSGYQIDLSTPSRMNCLYKRIASMNKANKDYCESKSKMTKYVAQDGYLYVNIKDMCRPQIKLLAKRLECKEHEIVSCLFDLLHKKYLKEKGELEGNDNE